MFEKKYEVYATAVHSNGSTWESDQPKRCWTRSGADRYLGRIQRINDKYASTSLVYKVGRIGLRGYTYEILDKKSEGLCPYRLVVRYKGTEITGGGFDPNDYGHRRRELRERAVDIAERHKNPRGGRLLVEGGAV